MPYDERLAARVRECLDGTSDATEQRMFGGLAFLVGGNMAVVVSGRGGLMVRVDPEQAAALLASGEAGPVEMRGRKMRGWVLVDPSALRRRRGLTRWVELGTARARSLPARP